MLLTPRPASRRPLAAGVVVALLLASLAVAPAAQAAGPTACPASFPTNQAVDGVTGVGYTVERGTTPDPFTAQILGRITDGIAPGIDMIMADLDSPALDRAGGVWQGMSGSPVYASNGRLIGAVAYGLSTGPSSIAGLTPASSMKPILTQLAAATTRAQANAAMRERVSVSKATADRLRTAGATAAQASGGFQQLAVPLWVSGSSNSNTQPLFDRLQEHAPGTRVFAGGSRAPGTTAPASSISAGGNFVAGLSYGVATLAATGTTTFVCDGKAVAFGHPFFSAGAVKMSAHPATAVFVQPDPTLVPFKVANPGGVAGTVDRDVLTGVRAQLGVAPSTTLITSSLTPTGGTALKGTTRAVYPPFTPDAGAFHTLFSIQRALGFDGGGSADVTITVKGVRASGKTFTLRIADKYANPGSLAFAVADQVYFLLFTLLDQPWEEIRLTSVSVNGTVDPTYRADFITSVRVKQGVTFVAPPSPIVAHPNADLAFRLKLTPFRGTTSKTLNALIPVPRATRGQFAALVVEAGEVFFESDATSFPALLNDWRNKPPNASIRFHLFLETSEVLVTVPTDAVVGFFDAFYDVSIE